MKLSEEIKQKIIDLYQNPNKKYTKKQIAELCQCSPDTVTRTLQKAGLQQIKLSPAIQQIEKDIVSDFEDGLYCKDIAIKYSIDEHTVYRVLDKNKIKRQSGYHSNCIEDYFAKIDNPHKAYLLGFITADGAIVNEVLSIEVNEEDIDVLKFAQDQINPFAKIIKTNKNCCRISFSAKAIGRDLVKYGIIQNKSKTIKEVPINLIPKELHPFYFRGLIDGDGCIHKDGKISIYSGSEDFIKHVQEILVEEIGVKKLKIYHGTTYFITWGAKEDKQKLFNYLYNNLNDTFYYKRKYNFLNGNI